MQVLCAWRGSPVGHLRIRLRRPVQLEYREWRENRVGVAVMTCNWRFGTILVSVLRAT